MLPEKKVSFFYRNTSTKERGQGIVIPNIPKVVDERARIRLLCDYEKYESELFKHHLGTPETTRTLGLKFVPVDFDRRLPSRDEPTLAEREYEASRRFRKKNRQSSYSAAISGQSPRYEAADAQPAAFTLNEAANTSLMQPSTVASTSVPLPEHVLPLTMSRNRSVRPTRAPSIPVHPPLPPEATVLETSEKKTAPVAAQKKLSPTRPLQQTSQEKESKPQPEMKMETIRPTVPEKQLRPASSRKSGAVSGSSGGLPQSKSEKVLSAEHCAQLLRVLLCTPPEYSESFKLDLRNIDLRWMHGSRYPSSFVTLHTWHPPENGASVPSLNSPRSVIVMLQNGIAVDDLVPHTTIHDGALLPTDPELRQLVKRMRIERKQRCRENLLQTLSEKYMELCRSVNLADVLKAFRNDGKRNIVVEIPASLKIDHERRQRALLMERNRLEKQINYAKDLHTRQLIADERQLRAEEEAQARIEAKKAEERLAHERAAERLALQRQKIAEREAFYRKVLQERQARAAERQARYVEAQQQKMEHRRKEQQRLAEERHLRFERVAERQEKQKLMIQQKHEAKEEKLHRLHEEQERRREELHAKILESAAKSMGLRELVRKRAAMHEEKVRQLAEEQQQKVEERLVRFRQSSKEARARRALEEEKKRTRTKEVLTAAAEKINSLKEETIKKQEKHNKLFDELQHQREAELVTRQEREREDMEAKSFAVVRNKRVTEFAKLETVLQLLSKREAALSLEMERAVLRQEMCKAREAMVAERQALKAKVQQTEITL
ncbi:hypothetical protein TraAM80_02116 [Trypanosoma rangeli]|uniref:Uncharacterized protein n=1 Tax=Trypanosoma rangeli TaxID=5698 RepID=A0A3R7KTP5_TRYRA|nr:uncharacterized protein TraAM80_02116 [Trypanosoma rangeli]RNF09507.1 hypothetical protein TraAM80_02116 [Trypanosoma rangeli]|eukprot:RNF09507.1 hypothetical protein TraAM80_02116 [Trypanosoma rangeli]